MAADITEQTSDTSAKSPRRERPMQTGVVTSNAGDKTITVAVSRISRHSKYGKALQRRTKLRAHDEKNEANNGDTVVICECRPLSKTKQWRLVRILRRAPQGGAS